MRMFCGTVGVLVAITIGPTACNWGSGSAWVKEPLAEDESSRPQMNGMPPPPRRTPRAASRTLGAPPNDPNEPQQGNARKPIDGRVLGTFRNTYYDFPRQADHKGDLVALMNASCAPIAQVPRGFYEAVCVQGSGSLASGGTVAFAKRDCACAEVCPRTGQKICFEALDARAFPFGRGAMGKAITPFRTIAADTSVLPLATIVYVPELDGVERVQGGPIDGCFVVEDRGLRVRGEHIDIFTGSADETAAINQRVPSNQGVTVVVDSARCAHLARPAGMMGLK